MHVRASVGSLEFGNYVDKTESIPIKFKVYM